MEFASALSTKTEWTEVVEDLTKQIFSQLSSQNRDIALLFLHPDYLPEIDNLVESLRGSLGARHFIGCTGRGIIGVQQEVEGEPAVSALVGSLPGVQLKPFYLSQLEIEEASGPDYWRFQLEIEKEENPNFLLFMDPFSIQTVDLITQLNEAFPSAPMVGGIASGGNQPGENRLILDELTYEEGGVGISLSGNIELQTIVSQGCKPIGEPMVVTKAEKNIIFELGGMPPLTILHDLLPTLSTSDQLLAKKALFLGRVINEYQEEFHRGDFLIRNLIGTDMSSGALAVGDYMRTGQTVQFHVRDAMTAKNDLQQLLAKHSRRANPTYAALLFNCLGRGKHMYGTSDHDINAVHESMGPLPTAGFFCNGEIGPVGNHTYVHGFTSVIALFSEPHAKE